MPSLGLGLGLASACLKRAPGPWAIMVVNPSQVGTERFTAQAFSFLTPWSPLCGPPNMFMATWKSKQSHTHALGLMGSLLPLDSQQRLAPLDSHSGSLCLESEAVLGRVLATAISTARAHAAASTPGSSNPASKAAARLVRAIYRCRVALDSLSGRAACFCCWQERCRNVWVSLRTTCHDSGLSPRDDYERNHEGKSWRLCRTIHRIALDMQ